MRIRVPAGVECETGAINTKKKNGWPARARRKQMSWPVFVCICVGIRVPADNEGETVANKKTERARAQKQYVKACVCQFVTAFACMQMWNAGRARKKRHARAQKQACSGMCL